MVSSSQGESDSVRPLTSQSLLQPQLWAGPEGWGEVWAVFYFYRLFSGGRSFTMLLFYDLMNFQVSSLQTSRTKNGVGKK